MTDAKAEQTKGQSGSEVVFMALGGLGEIGMNVYLYGLGPAKARRWLMVDLGLTFPGDAEPGVDVVLPDLRFIIENRAALEGILITHAHEDHIGAVIDLWPKLQVPIYCTPFSAGMLEAKLAEQGGGGKRKLPIKRVAMGSRFDIGPFDVELITMSHSIPEPSGVAIRTPHGLIFHTGDWKLDQTPLVGAPTDVAKLQALGEEGVAALICDSTNAFREGTSPSETEVAESLTEIIKKAKRRVAVTTFASNVARIRAVADAARASGRQLVVVGRAMHRVIQVAIDTGYLPQDFTYLDQNKFSYLDREDVLALCTGSQGEPRAALARISEEQHPDVSLGSGDLVIFSSRTIPGNEKSVGRIQNSLARLGCEIVTDADALVHVTGHPRRGELKQMYGWLKPKVVVPMHGEMRHLQANAQFAKSLGVPDVRTILNGEMARIAPAPTLLVDEAPVGRVFRDGRLIIADGDGPVRERRKLAHVGIVMLALVLSRKGDVVGDPDVEIDGVPYENSEGYSMEDVALDAAEGAVESIPPSRRKDVELVREAVRRSVRAAVDQAWGKKPIVKVLITQLDGKG